MRFGNPEPLSDDDNLGALTATPYKCGACGERFATKAEASAKTDKCDHWTR